MLTADDSMSEPVQLLKMKHYVLSTLSTSEQDVKVMTNGGAHVNGKSPPTLGKDNNGFIPNREYGDWDSTLSPKRDDDSTPSTQPRQPTRSRPTATKPTQKFIPEHEIEIPVDGSLRDFTTDDMSTFLRYMGVEERIVTHVHKKGLDGHKFAKLKDSDLEALSMKNPIICHFRDKSGTKEKGGKKKAPFML